MAMQPVEGSETLSSPPLMPSGDVSDLALLWAEEEEAMRWTTR